LFVADPVAQKEDVKVKSLDKCDFRPMFDHFEREREKKKAMTKDEKKA
jgi:DNA topoisomerase-1